MNRRMQHRVVEDTETGRFPDLCVLLNSALNCFCPGSLPASSQGDTETMNTPPRSRGPVLNGLPGIN